MAIDLQKLEQKFNALLEDENFVTEFEQWLEARNVSQNSSKPHVSSSLLPPDKIWLLKEIAHPYIYETAEEGTYSIATQGIEKILEYYERLRQQ